MYKKGRMNRVRKEKATFRNLDKEMLNIIEYNSWGDATLQFNRRKSKVEGRSDRIYLQWVPAWEAGRISKDDRDV